MARKGENIYKRKDGRWEGRFIKERGLCGKAKYGYVYAKTYTEAKAKLFSERKRYDSNGGRADDRKKTYEHWLEEWLSSKKGSIKESTYIRYKNLLRNHIIPSLGSLYPEKIKSRIIEDFIAEKLTLGRIDRRGGLSPKTVSDLLVIVKESVGYIQDTGISVSCRFERPPRKANARETRVLSNAEERSLNRVLMTDTDLGKIGILICLYTGIRIGELCALKWKNISAADRTLSVEHTMQRLQTENTADGCKTKIAITEPKSLSSFRKIPLPDFLFEQIIRFRGKNEDFLLSGSSTCFVEPRTMQNRFKAYLREGGIEPVNFHALRHTFATRCIEAGIDIKALSEILGHSSVKITLDKYVHASMSFKRSNIEKLRPAI